MNHRGGRGGALVPVNVNDLAGNAAWRVTNSAVDLLLSRRAADHRHDDDLLLGCVAVSYPLGYLGVLVEDLELADFSRSLPTSSSPSRMAEQMFAGAFLPASRSPSYLPSKLLRR